MEQTWISGKPTALDAAIAEAAKLIGASTRILITGLGTDVAGARAAIALARCTGAVIDHMNSETVLRDLEVMRSSGVMMTTPTECHARADTLLLTGPIRGAARNQLLQHVIGSDQPKNGGQRRIIWLCPGRDLLKIADTIDATPIGREQKDLPGLLATLRADIALDGTPQFASGRLLVGQGVIADATDPETRIAIDRAEISLVDRLVKPAFHQGSCGKFRRFSNNHDLVLRSGRARNLTHS